jgi:quercetin dioxygenase-like cupin family protein
MAKSSIAWTAAAVLVAALCTADAQSSDAVAVAPDIHRVVVDNQYVRVLETRFRPGQRVALHSHPARVIVVLDNSRTRVTSQDGRAEIVDHKVGDVFWSDPTAHSLEAITGEVHEIETEIKPTMPPVTDHSAQGVSELFPQLARIVFENARVRVVDLRGEPSQAFPLHFHPPRVTVRLGSARMRIIDPDGSTRLTDQQFGFTNWGDPVQHSDAVVIGVFHVIDIEQKARAPTGR